MIRHTLLFIIRNFKRHKGTFFINFIGLSTGLASTLLIYLWVMDELHIDKHNAKDAQLYQVLKNAPSENGISTSEQMPGRLAEALAKEMPEVEYASAVVPPDWFGSKGIISVNENRIKAEGQFISKDYFNSFSYQFSQGNQENVLSDKYGVVIAKSIALKLFHTTDNVVGKTITWNHERFSGDFLVSGVFEELPANSTMHADILFNYALFLETNPRAEDWRNGDPNTYLILKKGTDIAAFNNKIAGFIKGKQKEATVTLFVQRYGDRYLHGAYENGVPSGGRISYIHLFALIAVFVLVNACINFMSLSTAKALRRFKEVGVKKVLGVTRKTLIFQFLGESVLISFISLGAACILMLLLLPYFNQITGKNLSFRLDPTLIVGAISIALSTGILSGSYPSLYLSRFSPAVALKGKLQSYRGGHARKGLVMFQSVVSIVLIVCSTVVYNQINYVNTTNLGYHRDHIVYFEKGGNDFKDPKAYEADLESFIQDLKNIPGVSSATNFRHSITNRNGGTTDIQWEGKNPDNAVNFTDFAAGYDLIETLGIEMKEGRSYSRDFPNEKTKVVLNERAVAEMGLTNPVGKTIRIWGSEREIIGVTKNFHFQSLYEEIKPLFFDFSLNKRVSKIMVRINATSDKEVLGRIQEVYQNHNPGLAFEYSFLNTDYQKLYESENKVATLSKYFAGIAIVISCLGLVGLSAFAAERRFKEIGIRKILGATEFRIINLLSADFIKTVIISISIAVPLSYYISKNWLDSFSYRIDLTVWYFAGASLATLLLTWLAVGIQTVKAARMNPVKSLQIE